MRVERVFMYEVVSGSVVAMSDVVAGELVDTVTVTVLGSSDDGSVGRRFSSGAFGDAGAGGAGARTGPTGPTGESVLVGSAGSST